MGKHWISLTLQHRPLISRSGGTVSSVAVGPNGIYAADRYDDIVKLDRSSLTELWRRPADKLGLIDVYQDAIVFIGGWAGQIVALEAQSGKELWRHQTPHGSYHWADRIVALTADTVQVLDQATGEVRDAIEVPGGIHDGGSLCGDVLLFAPTEGAEALRAFSLQEGRLLWERDLLSEMRAGYGVDQEFPVVGLIPASDPSRFIATRGTSTFGCSLDDGRILWHVSVPVPYYWPNVHEGRIYVLDHTRFTAIDEATGHVVCNLDHPELHGAYRHKAGTIYDGKLAIPSESGHLAVFHIDDGTVAWSHQYKSAPLWRTGEADGRLLVTTGDGRLLVFEDK